MATRDKEGRTRTDWENERRREIQAQRVRRDGTSMDTETDEQNKLRQPKIHGEERVAKGRR